jgi:glutamate synthase (NADPH/NADH) large chain
MTGGMAYLYDPDGVATSRLNMETLVSCPVTVSHWQDQLKELTERHATETGSERASDILQNWDLELSKFIQICPKEMLNKMTHPLEIAEMSIPAE